MIKHKKVTYTIDRRSIAILEKRSFLEEISKSKLLSQCIQSGYELMIEEYYEYDNQPRIDQCLKKRSGTIPKTFNLPIEVEAVLSWFSEELNLKKSHLVIGCIINFDREESKKLSQQIDEMMKFVTVDNYYIK